MILGVTGGMGSGKTTVCRVFNTLGVPVFYTDVEAKILMDSDPELKEKLNVISGTDLYLKGNLDRGRLASLIFTNKGLLLQVNELVHPFVFRSFKNWVSLQNSGYVIMESAILFESRATVLVNKILSVIAPEEERIDRVFKRNNLTVKQIRERIESQISDEDRIKMSDYLIFNSDKDMIIPSILNIHNDILGFIKNNYL